MKDNHDLKNLKNNSMKQIKSNNIIDIPIKFSELSEKISIKVLSKEIDISKIKIDFYVDVIVSTSPKSVNTEISLNTNEIFFSLDYSEIPFKLNIGKFEILYEEKSIQTVLIQIVKDKNIFYKNLLY